MAKGNPRRDEEKRKKEVKKLVYSISCEVYYV
jgi:hypothetical protein